MTVTGLFASFIINLHSSSNFKEFRLISAFITGRSMDISKTPMSCNSFKPKGFIFTIQLPREIFIKLHDKDNS